MDATECGLSAVGDRLLLAQFSRPRADRRTRLAVLGDPHVATRSRETYRVFHRTEQRLRTAIDDCNERDVDLVVFPGDLTKDGELWNYDRVDVLLEELERPFVATPAITTSRNARTNTTVRRRLRSPIGTPLGRCRGATKWTKSTSSYWTARRDPTARTRRHTEGSSRATRSRGSTRNSRGQRPRSSAVITT